MDDIIDWKRNTLLLDHSSYSAIYTSHTLVSDKFNQREIYTSAEAFGAAVISKTATEYEPWFAPAGWKRGSITIRGLKRKYDEPERDVLDDAGINTIRFKPGKGMAIWGNKTTLGRPSTFQFLNVRMLLITIKPAIAAALEDYIFEQNDEPTRIAIKALIEDYMAVVKARRGVYNFLVTCSEENNKDADIENGILHVWLFIRPTVAVQWIKFKVAVTRLGYDFKLAEASLGA